MTLIQTAIAPAGPDACAVLDTAAEVLGIAGLRRTDRIHVNVPGSRPRHQRADGAVVVHQLAIEPHDRTSVDGIPATTVVRTLADVILRVSRYEAVGGPYQLMVRPWMTERSHMTPAYLFLTLSMVVPTVMSDDEWTLRW